MQFEVGGGLNFEVFGSRNFFLCLIYLFLQMITEFYGRLQCLSSEREVLLLTALFLSLFVSVR